MARRRSTINWKKILVPIDFSEGSKMALPYAIGIARDFGATVSLAHVVPSTTPADLTHLGIVLEEKRLLKQAQGLMRQFRANQLPSDTGGKDFVLSGSPAPEICRLAAKATFDLIVLATHGHSGLKHLWLGSVAEKVVRHAPCPVLTIREEPLCCLLPDVNPMRVKRILVPTDFSELSRGAVVRAAQLARRLGAQIDLIYVIEPPPYPEYGYAHIPMKEAGLRELAEIELANLQHDVPDLKELVRETVVRTGNVPFEILQSALLLNSELIVMATHARKGLKHFALGSNTEKVVRQARCPVLVFPPHH